ncbi:hypothetical protein MMC07_004812 [Pseudocyphellaria aurata]|nr:hypothetical protein [Pseudocyphellaria aurata]
MDAFDPLEEEQHALPSSNQQDYANRLGEHQITESANRKRKIVQVHHPKHYDSLHTTQEGHPPKRVRNSKELAFTRQSRRFNCKGPPPCEAPGLEAMEDAATQPATQLQEDSRRVGINSMFSEKDECDVLCILHPSSFKAMRAVQCVADSAPQHILQNENLIRSFTNGNGSFSESSTRSVTASPHGSLLESSSSEPKSQDGLEGDGRSLDIALRLSSKLKDPCHGFAFGRGPWKSDLNIAPSGEHCISTRHFRIYVKSSGVVMLEDTSTNGTFVDDTPLYGDSVRFPRAEKRRMLHHGSVIKVVLDYKNTNLEDTIRFIVKFPSRDRVGDRWQNNLQNYLDYISQAERQRAVRAETSQQGAATAILYPIKPFCANDRPDSILDVDANKTLTAGSKVERFGMEWNGGEKYNVVGSIGQGGFALVFKLATKRDGDVYAAKQIEKRRFMKNGIVDSKIRNEMHIMKDLQHPHIVKFIEHQETSRHLYLIMEYVPSGDLSAYLLKKEFIPEFFCQRLAWQICSALEYLHKRNITHRDIKPENILLESEDPVNAKLSDFGLSKQISNNDPWLKTFCGTILYCAPEVYPDYERYTSGKAVKRRRPNDPPPKTLPYQQSVDIWAFAAVLYHLIAACPPYEGSIEYPGPRMLHKVMTSPIDFGKMRTSGASDMCVDFVSKMLKHDPLARATEVECLQHPWLASQRPGSKPKYPMNGTTELDAIEEDEGKLPIEEDQDELDPSQLSQLSLTENHGKVIVDSDLDYETDVDELADTRQSKRFKASNEGSRGVQRVPSGQDIAYPTLPAVQSSAIHPGRNRLFGEIGSSALRSSGDLSHDARTALEMPYQGSHDGSVSPAHSPTMKERHVTGDELAQHPAQFTQSISDSFFTRAAPSLLGAEAMVGNLDMGSSEFGASVPFIDSVANMPEMPKLSETTVSSSKSPRLASHSTHESVSKRTKTTRLDAPKQIQPGESSTKHRSKRTKTTRPDGPKQTQPGESSTNHQSHGSQTTGALDQALPEPSAPATGAERASNESDRGEGNTQPPQDSAKSAGKAEFTVPNPPLGVLTTLPGSIVDMTIKLDNRHTYFGRDPSCSYRFADKMELRVPKNAIDIVWWCPGLEAMIASGKNWMEVEGLVPLIHTRTSLHIRVNGVKLMKGKDCWTYGRLHTGDVVSVFGPAEGKSVEGKAGEFLKFRCEIFVGPNARPRDEPFVIEKEVAKYRQSESRHQTQNQSDGQGGQGNAAGDKGKGREITDGPELDTQETSSAVEQDTPTAAATRTT